MRVKLLTENNNDLSESIIEFRHKSIFEYFAARAVKCNFDLH